MKIARLTFFIAALAFMTGFWAACSIGFDETEGQFSCTKDQDCIAPFRCLGGICQPSGTSACVDVDGDGFGVGEMELRRDCPKCLSEDACAEDCNDNDASVAPNRQDTCDGKDNNCNNEIDEVIPCESSIDCPDESPYTPFCDTSVDPPTCVYKTPISIGNPECVDPVACVDGAREERSDDCF